MNFLDVIDLLFQRKDYLALFPYYHSLGFVREYVDKKQPGKSFYLDYFYHIRELALELPIDELGQLTQFITNPYAMCVFIDFFILKIVCPDGYLVDGSKIVQIIRDISILSYNTEVRERITLLRNTILLDDIYLMTSEWYNYVKDITTLTVCRLRREFIRETGVQGPV